jgi:hypothetical protein
MKRDDEPPDRLKIRVPPGVPDPRGPDAPPTAETPRMTVPMGLSPEPEEEEVPRKTVPMGLPPKGAAPELPQKPAMAFPTVEGLGFLGARKAPVRPVDPPEERVAAPEETAKVEPAPSAGAQPMEQEEQAIDRRVLPSSFARPVHHAPIAENRRPRTAWILAVLVALLVASGLWYFARPVTEVPPKGRDPEPSSAPSPPMGTSDQAVE